MLVIAVAVLCLALTTVFGAEGLARARVRAVRLLVVAGLLQIGTALVAPHSQPLRIAVMMVSALLVALFVGGNWHVPGVPLVGLGLLLNATVVGLNLAMPVSVAAAERAGLSEEDLALATDPLHERAGSGTHLGWLGDTIPVALPWRPQVVSPGDVLAAAGVGLFLVTRTPERRRPSPRQNRDGRPTVFARESTTRGSYS